MVHVTGHAIERYRERVSALGDEEIVAALSTPLIEAAAEFGARYVRLGSGQRVVLSDNHVVTVLPRHCRKRRLREKENGDASLQGD